MADDKIEFDPDSLTWAELIEIEEATGRPALAVVLDWLANNASSVEQAKIAHIVVRRTDPELTFEDHLQSAAPLTMDRIVLTDGTGGGGAAEDPPVPAEPNA